jgi:MFS family permease
MIWLIYRTTESPFLLGLAAFAAEIPFLIVSPFGGLVADRVDRRRTLMLVQFIAAMQSFALVALITLDAAPYPVLVALGLLLGVCQAIETPVRQSMFPDLVVDPADIPNAVSLMAFMNNSGRLIGPIIAGLLVASTGERTCFLLCGLSFLVVIGAISRIRLRPGPAQPSLQPPILRQLQTGFAYAWTNRAIRNALCMLAVVSFCGLPYLVVMPVFTSEVLKADAQTLGFLLSCAGGGGLTGLAMLALRTKIHKFPRVIALATCIGTIGLVTCSLAHEFLIAAIGMTLLGYGIVVTATASNIYLQFQSAVDKRGRVLGLFSFVFFGFAPIGNIVAGYISDHFGSQTALGTLGITAAAATAIVAFQWRREIARPVRSQTLH